MSMPNPLPSPAPVGRYPFEARPLTDPVDPAAVTRFEDDLRRRFPGLGPNIAVLVVVCVLAVPFLLVFFAILGMILSTFVAVGFGLIAVPFAVFVAAVLGLMVWLIVRQVRGRSRDHRYRLDAFARANAMHYVPMLANPNLPGLIFSQGGDRRATDLLRGEQPRFVEFANYRYTTSDGKNSTTHHWGYVAIHLGTPLPHIVLDAVGNNGMLGSNLPASFDRQQRLSLEGDFDQHFTLYCPQGYERDALYLFTPDVMVRFLDRVGQLDVEIVDEWLFLYTRRPVSTTDPANWAWLFSAVSALMDKLAQWERWRDGRLAAETGSAPPAPAGLAAASPLPFHTSAATPPPPAPAWPGPKGVAQPGRRLRRRIPWVVIVVVGVVLLLLAAPLLLAPLLLLLPY